MKFLITSLLILFVAIHSIVAQDNTVNTLSLIDSLKLVIEENNRKIEQIQLHTKNIYDEIDELKEKQNEVTFDSYEGKTMYCVMGTFLYADIKNTKSIIPLKRNDKVKVIENLPNQYKVLFQEHTGYISKRGVISAEEYEEKEKLKEQEKIKKEQEQLKKEQDILKEQAAKEELRKLEFERRKNNLIKKYGKVNGTLIIEEKVRIGMNKDMVIESWGKPKDINRTTGVWGVHEQWVYGDFGPYLYFENGKLTTIQD